MVRREVNQTIDDHLLIFHLCKACNAANWIQSNGNLLINVDQIDGSFMIALDGQVRVDRKLLSSYLDNIELGNK